MKIIHILSLFIVITLIFLGCSTKSKKSFDNIIFVCDVQNDLFRAASTSMGEFPRFVKADAALEAAKSGSALLLLADDYPAGKTKIPHGFLKKTKSKNIKLYLEFPDSLPGIKSAEIKTIKWERGVVTADVFGELLPPMSIVSINDSHYLEMMVKHPLMVLARVAGFDNAVYGLAGVKSHPVLFEMRQWNSLVSTTKLSQFITGRYAPNKSWKAIWTFIFNYLRPNEKMPNISWLPSVRPTFAKGAHITDNERLQAVKRGVEWYYRSNLLATTEDVKNGVTLTAESGRDYGKEGIRECYLSKINYDGSQPISNSRRADCAGETAMALALYGMMTGNETDKATAENLLDYIFFNSRLRKGPRNDVDSPEYGFIDWYERANDHEGVYYSDDNARVDMGAIVAAVALKSNRWDEFVMANILANFRATSLVTGFKPRRLDGSPKSGNTLANGWKPYHKAEDYYHFAPHYQSWMMALYLWLYDKTHYKPLLNTAKRGIENMMNAYPHKWEWTNGLQQERARMILPLAWLLRIENTPRHKVWLDTLINDLLAFQDDCGAIREEIGGVGLGKYAPPKSNAQYGTSEAPLIQENGEPVADMLYTSNFAFFSLTEAAAVTGDKKIKKALDKLADFMVMIQVKSDARPELDGAWYRGFDYGRWEYWASNADLGWGVWSSETGWTQGWITSMLMMKEMEINFWDFTEKSKIAESFKKYEKLMLSEVEENE